MTSSIDRDEQGYFAERGFGLRIGFGERPAVVSIDFMNAFTDEGMPLGSDLDSEIAAARSLLDSARGAGVPIFHTVVRYDSSDLSDAGIWRKKQAGLESLRSGTSAVEIDERIACQADEQVIVKKYASSFFATDLASRLTSLNVDTLLLLGCTTSGCVRATAVDAVQLGYRPMVVKEAVGDRSPASHHRALFDLEQKYADVVSVREGERYLSDIEAR